MRELKFRGWHEDDKVMVYKINSLRLFDGELKADDYILMQFTGLKDKNGKEIYEGDLIQDYYYDYSINELKKSGDPTVVESKLQSSCGCCATIYGWAIDISENTSEVIGNIYENPELLKK